MFPSVPRALRGRHEAEVVLAVVDDYVACGEQDRWFAVCPECGGCLLVMAWLGDGVLERREDFAVVWCLDGCEAGVPERSLGLRAWRLAAREHRPVEDPLLDPRRPVGLPCAPSAAAEGERNRVMFSFACALRDVGLNVEQIWAELVSVNDRVCSPPLPDRDLVVISRSAGRYAPSRRAFPAPGVMARFRGIVSRRPVDADRV